jgi:DNA (cytosine-5)-methyltransferase 1
MTVTQIPILGPERRFLTRREGLRLQGFLETHLLPQSRQGAFAALGNAVHTRVVLAIAHRLFYGKPHPLELAASGEDEEAETVMGAAG